MRLLTENKVVLATMMVVGAVFSPLSAQEMQMPPALVEVTEAEVRELAPTMDLQGTVISINDSRIAAEVEGPVSWIAQAGTYVEKGGVIAKIDDRLIRLQVRQAEANVARLKADMVYRQEEVERFSTLAQRDNTSKSRLQQVTAARAMLEQDILEAEALLERAQGDLAKTEIKAPFPGHVVARLANVGEYLTMGAEVMRLVDTKDQEITVAAPITVAPFLKEGAVITVFDAQKSMDLPIRSIIPVGDRTSRMMEVRLSVDAGNWVVGAPVKVRVPKGEARTAVAIPRDALILKGGQAYYFEISADNKAVRVDVDIRGVVGHWAAVGTGTEAGDKVIIRGGERLNDGQDVQVKAP
jgi:RND family efflux transporter MFP subunit